jgi:hypothetical protein
MARRARRGINARPKKFEEAKEAKLTVRSVAERLKEDLATAIAAEKVFRPAARDKELMAGFAVGYAGPAFDLLRHSILYMGVMALMRLWDNDTKVYSIPTLARLLRDPGEVQQLTARERAAVHETKVVENFFGEGRSEVPFTLAQCDPDLRERELKKEISLWLRKVKFVKSCAEIARITKHRHERIAHSAASSRRPNIETMRYGDERVVLGKTLPLVSKGYYLATGIKHDFSSTVSVWHRMQTDMWQIVRKAQIGEQFTPPPERINLIDEMRKRGFTSMSIKGR